MLFCGDLHGQFEVFDNIIATQEEILQVGDLGIGFLGHAYPKEFPQGVHFIYGNHDNPEVCRNHPNCLGDYSFEELKDGRVMLCISGAFSIDREYRTIGVNFWEDEELSYSVFDSIISQVRDIRPEIIVSHTLPSSIFTQVTKKPFIKQWQGRTGLALSELYKVHQPDLWIAGHLHLSAREKVDNTQFIVLDIGEVLDLPDIQWK